MHQPQAPHPVRSFTDCLLHIFDMMSYGGVLLDAGKRVVAANACARAHVGDGLVLRRGRMHAADGRSDALLQQIIDRLLQGSAEKPKHDALGLGRRGKRPLIVRIVPLQPEAYAIFDNAALIVIILDPDDCPQPSLPFLRQVFGLTRSEARVATQLLCGESIQGVAQAAGVSLGTVRSQVKSVFAKTQTNRQSDLVALLTRLALISEDRGAQQSDAAKDP